MSAPCPHLQQCTGCPLMRLPYLSQLKRKALGLEEVLGGRHLKAGLALQNMVRSPVVLGTRISAKLALHQDPQGRRSIGLFRQGSRQIVSIPRCSVHHPGINALLQQLPLKGPSVPDFYQQDARSFQPGKLKYITVRHAPESGRSALVLSHTGVAVPLLKRWLSALAIDVSVYELTLTEADADRILTAGAVHLQGPASVEFRIGAQSFDLSPLVFFQNNYALAPALIAAAVTFSASAERALLLDLYGGMGAYAFHAQGFKQRLLIDLDPASIAAATAYAAQQGLRDFRAIAAPVEDALAQLSVSECQKVTHALVNPPRRGLSPAVLRALTARRFTALRELHYVSCGPESLRRDLDLLAARGFRVESVTPFDLFPQTAHLETLVRLSRRS